MIFRFTLSHETLGSAILSQDPQGWKDMETIVKRGLEYHGTFYQTMVQLEFACGSGKEFIDEVYDTYGVDAVINILIEISCRGSSGAVYSNDYSDDYSDDYGSQTQSSGSSIFTTFYEGTLDLSKYNKTSRSTFVDILQSDFIQKVLNRFATNVDVLSDTSIDEVALPAIDGFPSDVTLHSKQLVLTTEYEYFDDPGSQFVIFPLDGLNIEIPQIVVSDDIGGALSTGSPNVFSFLLTGSPGGYENTQPVFTNTTTLPIIVTINYDIQGTLTIRNTYSCTPNYFLLLQVGGIQFAYVPFPTTLQNINNIPVPSGTDTDVAVSATGATVGVVLPGESIFLCFYFADVVGNNAAPGLFEFVSFVPTTYEFTFINQSTTPATSASIFKIHELGTAIAQRITSQEDCFRSDLLGRKNSEPVQYDENGCGSFMGSLNGKHIRGFTPANSPYFTSMDAFFKTINSIWNVGIGFEKSGDNYLLRLEPKEYFYDTTTILQCPFVKEIKTSVAKEYYISDIYIGYEKWETENINGLDEFNTKRQYTTGIKSIESRLNVESPYIASMYSIELSRRAGVSTEDYTYDNDNFIICLGRGVDGDGVPDELDVAEKNENFDTTDNFKSPATAYNIRISPARNLLNHMNSIAGSIYKYASRAVKFMYGEGNYDVETEFTNDICPNNFDNEILSESQDITIAQANVNPIWIPEYLEFEYPLSLTDFFLIKDSPYKCIEASTSDTNYQKCFIVEMRYKPVGGMASFKLLKAWQ
jgi:hypothetical protein